MLHHSGLVIAIGLFLVFQLFLRLLGSTPYHILGFTSSISIDEVVRATNEQRIASGLQPLNYSETLADAARRKAANMFEENYWAHNSPSGKNPWVWFAAAGYQYTHAGENLAKDFGSTDRMMSAWMNSPTHRDNIVSAKYDEIGIAVVPGSLLGQDTVLVVQLFGSRRATGSVPATPTVASVETTGQTLAATPAPTILPIPTSTPRPAVIAELAPASITTPAPSAFPTRYNVFNVKKTVALVTTALLMLALVLDLVIAENKLLSRRVGKNWAHLMFINVILILVTLVQAGNII